MSRTGVAFEIFEHAPVRTSEEAAAACAARPSDEMLCRNERVAFNAGSTTVSITMRCEDLVRLAGATVCHFVVTSA